MQSCFRHHSTPSMADLQVKVESKPWSMELPSGRKLEVELTTLSSNYHVEMNPSDVGNNDRYVVQVRPQCFSVHHPPAATALDSFSCRRSSRTWPRADL